MSSGRFLGGLLIGGALGAVFGLLVAPRKGEETRELIRDEINNRVGEVNTRVSQSLEEVRHKSDELKGRTLDAVEHLKEKSQSIAQELENAGLKVLEKANRRKKTDVVTDTP